MRPLKYIPAYTVTDYNRWEGDWELIDGIPYAMSPSPMRRHQLLVALLVRYIGNSIHGQKEQCGDCVVVSDLDWIINETTVVRPDIAIICNETGSFITTPPALIIEILSPSTAFKDRQVKFDIYQEQGVKYYLLVDPDKRTYTIYQLTDGQYKEQNNITSFIIRDNCRIHLDVDKPLLELGME